MNYIEAIRYLENCFIIGSKKGHENLKRLLSLFDNPQDKLNIIHVCGTNGKGSTCTMISEVLKEEGYKVGMFTSPHLSKYNERFKLNDEYISDEELARHVYEISRKVEEHFENEYFSFFEVLTVIAFNYFYEKNVDFLALEVGLGGRLDATNVITKPLLSVITSISFDHTNFLGNTIEEIAKEKGGIIKKNSNVVLYCQANCVYNVIERICSEKEARLYYEDSYDYEVLHEDFFETIFNYSEFKNLKIRMIGDYQVKNACNSLTAIKVLKKLGVKISTDAIYRGLEKAKINGRMEIVSKEPFIILDGAHNVGGAFELNCFMKRLKENTAKKIKLLVGIVKDKDYLEMINLMAEFADEVIFTKPDSKRALEAKTLFSSFDGQGKKVFVFEDYREAAKKLTEESEKDILICSGSLYLIADLRSELKNREF